MLWLLDDLGATPADPYRKRPLLKFQIYKFKVVRSLNVIVVVLRFFSRNPKMVHLSDVRAAIRKGYDEGKSVVATAMRCSSIVLDASLSKISPSDRLRLIQELPTVDYDFILRFRNNIDILNRPPIIQFLDPQKTTFDEPAYPMEFLPGTLMIASIIATVGVYTMNNLISVEERNEVMEQIYGSLHGIPEDQRHGLDFQSLLCWRGCKSA